MNFVEFGPERGSLGMELVGFVEVVVHQVGMLEIVDAELGQMLTGQTR